jgi:hypothetical protein
VPSKGCLHDTGKRGKLALLFASGLFGSGFSVVSDRTTLGKLNLPLMTRLVLREYQYLPHRDFTRTKCSSMLFTQCTFTEDSHFAKASHPPPVFRDCKSPTQDFAGSQQANKCRFVFLRNHYLSIIYLSIYLLSYYIYLSIYFF